jgi:beta-lactamase class A
VKKQTWQIIVFISSILFITIVFKNELGNNSQIKNLLHNINFDFDLPQEKDITQINNERFEELKNKVSYEEGVYGIYIKDMIGGTVFEMNANEEFYPLSLFKLPIAYIVTRDVERGELKWDDTLIYKPGDFFNQYGTIHSFGFGSKYELKKVVELMLRESDNAAPIILKRHLGEEYLNTEFKKISGYETADLFDEELLTNPKKCGYLIEGIFYKKWISDESVNLLLSYLNPTSYDEALNPYLKENLAFYHKVGFSTAMYHNCGIIRSENKDLILCLMSKEITDESFDRVNQYVAEFVNNY